MVLLSSRPGLDPAAASRSTGQRLHAYAAPLLPKVRGQFAEFLNQGSLVHLGFLNLPTCVGVRYGHRPSSLAGLSCLFRRPCVGSPLPVNRPITSRSTPPGPFLRWLPTGLDGARLAAQATPQDPASVERIADGTGMSTGCPSASACACALGPTNPPRITRAAEPSGFRWGGFSPPFTVTHSGIRTRMASTGACAPTSTAIRRSPTTGGCPPVRSIGGTLGPAPVSAQRYSTSELLRTLSRMAASKPTSWLSARPHNLRHEASTGGP